MTPEVTEFTEWVELECDHAIRYVPTHVLTERDWKAVMRYDFGALLVYTDGQVVLRGGIVEGFGVRLASPDGSMFTPWEVFVLRREALNRAQELMKHRKGVNGDLKENPPSWAQDAAVWRRAEEAVLPRAKRYKEPYAVVAHVYKRMGGRVR